MIWLKIKNIHQKYNTCDLYFVPSILKLQQILSLLTSQQKYYKKHHFKDIKYVDLVKLSIFYMPIKHEIQTR